VCLVRQGLVDKVVYGEMRAFAFTVSAQRKWCKPVRRKNTLEVDLGDLAYCNEIQCREHLSVAAITSTGELTRRNERYETGRSGHAKLREIKDTPGPSSTSGSKYEVLRTTPITGITSQDAGERSRADTAPLAHIVKRTLILNLRPSCLHSTRHVIVKRH
jgi:hypothetical protein